jgi:hypothetical protein
MSTEAEEYPLLGAVTRQLLVKTEDLMFAVVICKVCRLAIVLKLFIVMSYKCSINPVNNPNPVSSHKHVTIYYQIL